MAAIIDINGDTPEVAPLERSTPITIPAIVYKTQLEM